MLCALGASVVAFPSAPQDVCSHLFFLDTIHLTIQLWSFTNGLWGLGLEGRQPMTKTNECESRHHPPLHYSHRPSLLEENKPDRYVYANAISRVVRTHTGDTQDSGSMQTTRVTVILYHIWPVASPQVVCISSKGLHSRNVLDFGLEQAYFDLPATSMLAAVEAQWRYMLRFHPDKTEPLTGRTCPWFKYADSSNVGNLSVHGP